MHPRCADDRGQLLPLVAVLMAAIGMAGLALGRTAGAARLAAEARTAADAAALAGAAAGEEEARRVAAANRGVVISYEAAGLDVRVGVRVEGHRASARARAAPTPAPSGSAIAAGAGAGPGLVPALRASLARAGDLLGRPVPITSGYRTRADQARLYARRGANPYPVAPPGTSKHERGLAVDVPAAFAERLAAVGPAVGLCRPYPRTDPVHFELCGRLPEKAPG